MTVGSLRGYRVKFVALLTHLYVPVITLGVSCVILLGMLVCIVLDTVESHVTTTVRCRYFREDLTTE